MSPEMKVLIIDFIESLNVKEGGVLYNKIVNHVREQGIKEPRRLHGGAGVTTAESPQGT